MMPLPDLLYRGLLENAFWSLFTLGNFRMQTIGSRHFQKASRRSFQKFLQKHWSFAHLLGTSQFSIRFNGFPLGCEKTLFKRRKTQSETYLASRRSSPLRPRPPVDRRYRPALWLANRRSVRSGSAERSSWAGSAESLRSAAVWGCSVCCSPTVSSPSRCSVRARCRRLRWPVPGAADWTATDRCRAPDCWSRTHAEAPSSVQGTAKQVTGDLKARD